MGNRKIIKKEMEMRDVDARKKDEEEWRLERRDS